MAGSRHHNERASGDGLAPFGCPPHTPESKHHKEAQKCRNTFVLPSSFFFFLLPSSSSSFFLFLLPSSYSPFFLLCFVLSCLFFFLYLFLSFFLSFFYFVFSFNFIFIFLSFFLSFFLSSGEKKVVLQILKFARQETHSLGDARLSNFGFNRLFKGAAREPENPQI